MASRPDVAHVYGIGTGRLDPPTKANLPGGTTATAGSPAVFDSIAKVKPTRHGRSATAARARSSPAPTPASAGRTRR